MNEDFVKIANTNEIQKSQIKEIEIEDQKIIIANIDGNFYAIEGICTHEGGPLSEGSLSGHEIECPWHGAKFDVRTEVTNPPATEPELKYELKIEWDQILIKKKIT